MKIKFENRVRLMLFPIVLLSFPLCLRAQNGMDKKQNESSAHGQPVPKLTLHYNHVSSAEKNTTSKDYPKNLTTELIVQISLPMGWHINSIAPPDSFLVPTKLEATAKNSTFAKPIFPEPEMVFSDAMGEKLPLYSGTFEVHFALVKPTLETIEGTHVVLNYQACNNAMCFPPKQVVAEM